MAKRWLLVVASLCSCLYLSFSSSVHGAETNRFGDSQYTATQYPIVLVPGLMGFDRAAMLVDYWFRIPQALRRGGADVYLVSVSPLNSTSARGEQLLEQVEKILVLTGKTKVHLFGHSQGAPTARYVAGVRPDLVASVVSIAGVNGGSLVADKIQDYLDGNLWQRYLARKSAEAIARALALISGNRDYSSADFIAALDSLTTDEAKRFNRRFPAGVQRRCQAGSSGRHTVDDIYNGVVFLSFGGGSPHTNVLDPGDLALHSIAYLTFGREPSDGLVSSCANNLGQVIRDDYHMNHWDAVNHLAGLTGTDPIAIYRQMANRLKRMGL